jgi:alpha-N-arabinofuranosidase
VTENNQFGTHEYMNFTELLGAEAYVAGNMGSGTPQEMAEWVEYLTSDLPTTVANERRANGRQKPWRLKYFGIGNESWGCGGNMRPEYSADLHKRYQTFVKAPPGTAIIKVATGANVDDYDFTRVMMERTDPRWHIQALSLHYYTFTESWEKKGAATGFGEKEWASTLKNALRMDDLINKHKAIMDKDDPQKKVALYVDEWGTWFDQEPGSKPGFLYQQNSLRDAHVAALTLNIFHRHTDRVKLAAIAQMVNVLQAMILTDGPRMVLTPTYHVFDMYVPFQGATPLQAVIKSPEYRFGEFAFPAADASAARGTDGKLYLSLINSDPATPARFTMTVKGMSPRKAVGRLLTGQRLDTHNTFEQPRTIVPVAFAGRVKGGRVIFDLPPKALAVLAVE